jgi:hypothetical protein
MKCKYCKKVALYNKGTIYAPIYLCAKHAEEYERKKVRK